MATKSAILLAAVCLMLCAVSARAADAPHRRGGGEVGGGWWTDHSGSKPRKAYVVSVGRWQRLDPSVTWVTRIESAEVRDLADVWPSFGKHDGGVEPAVIGWGGTWRDLGHSVTVQTGLAIHPPMRVGLAPYVGGNVGLGVARWGDEHGTYWTGSGWAMRSARGRTTPTFLVGGEVGLRLFPSGHWPSACAALGFRALSGPHGGGGSLEPVLSIGY